MWLSAQGGDTESTSAADQAAADQAAADLENMALPALLKVWWYQPALVRRSYRNTTGMYGMHVGMQAGLDLN